MWTDAEWRSFCLLLDRGFPGDFDDADREAYRVFLDRHAPAAVAAALDRWAANGKTWRPSASELVGALAADPSRPSFAEAVQLIYGPGGVLHARHRGEWHTESQRRALDNQAALQRAGDLHPLVAAFVHAMTVQRLREINLDDPDYGQARRAQLKAEWEDYCQRADLRGAAALAAGRAPSEGLKRFDPLAALGAGHKQITEGEV